MEAYVYEVGSSGYLTLKGITDKICSVSHTKRFYASDLFSIGFTESERNAGLIVSGSIIEIPGEFSGYITKIAIDRDSGGCGFIKASGCSFEGMLSRRVLISGTKGDSFMTILNKNAGDSADEERQFPCTYFDDAVDCDGLINSEVFYEGLDSYISMVGRKNGLGLKSEIVHSDSGARIRIFGRLGVDHSVIQDENTTALIADAYESASDVSYIYSESGAVNCGFVYSDSQCNSRGDTTCKSWKGFVGTDSGYSRCEEAYKIEPCVTYEAITYGDTYVWSPILDEDGTEEKAENYFTSRKSDFTDSLEAVLRINGSVSEIFDVGDTITLYSKRLNRTAHERVYKIEEILEDGVCRTVVFIGTAGDN